MNTPVNLCALILGAVSWAAMAADVGVSVHISQPGVYGRVDIGRFPQPQLVMARPIVVKQRQVTVVQPVQPVHMWVPPGPRQNWRGHCAAYNACGVPVYFVQDDWYDRHVRPHGKAHGHSKQEHKHKDKNKHKDEHHDRGGNGKGNNGKGKHGD